MPHYKITTFFEQGKQGWSESWYIESTAQAVANGRAQTLSAKRQNMLAEGVNIIGIKVSDVDVFGDSRALQGLDADAPDNANEQKQDVIGVGAQYLCEAGNQYRSVRVFRGMPDSYAVWDDSKERMWLTAKAQKLFEGFFKEIKTLDLRLKAKLAPPQVATVKVQDLSLNAQGNYQITTAAPHTLLTGEDVHFRGKTVGSYPKLRGEHTIFRIDDTSFEVRVEDVNAIPKYLGGVTYTKVEYGYVEYDDFVLKGVSKRDTGRPFGLSRGRSPKKCKE